MKRIATIFDTNVKERQSLKGFMLIPRIYVFNNGYSSFTWSEIIGLEIIRQFKYLMNNNIRISFFIVDKVSNFQLKSKARLIVRRVACSRYIDMRVSKRERIPTYAIFLSKIICIKKIQAYQ